MLNVVIEHGEHSISLADTHGLDDEPIIMGEEEEGPTFPSTFSGLEYFSSVLVYLEGGGDVRRGDAVEGLDDGEFVLLVTRHFSVDLDIFIVSEVVMGY